MDFPDQLKKPAPTRRPGLDALDDFLWEAASRDADAEQFLLGFHLARAEQDPAAATQRLLDEGLLADPGMRYRALRLLAGAGTLSADNLRTAGGLPYPYSPPRPCGPAIGREGEQSWAAGRLRRLVGISMVCITGPAGVGKTRLAEEIAAAREREGSGPRLQVQLSRPASGLELQAPARKAHDALLDLLLQLGVAEADVPAEPEQRKACYAARLAGQRPVIVIDRVIDESQVLDLLPPADGAVVVTSRRPLPELFGGNAHHLSLKPLHPVGSRLLIKNCFQAMGVVPDDAAIAAITGAAGGWPTPTVFLSRWMAAAAKAELSQTEAIQDDSAERAVLRTLASRLESAVRDRNDAARELPQSGEIPAFPAMAAVFDLLDDDQRTVVRALGLLRLPRAEVEVIGIITGLSEDRAQAALEELTDLGLAMRAGSSQSWTLDPQVANYAHADALLSGQFDKPGFQEMLGQIIDVYRRRAVNLRDQMPEDLRAQMPEPQPSQLREWWEAEWNQERDCIAAVLQFAVDTGHPARAHELAATFMDVASVTDAGESSRQKTGHYLDPILEIARAADDRGLQASVLERFASDAHRAGDTVGADILRNAANTVREGGRAYEPVTASSADQQGPESSVVPEVHAGDPVRVPAPSDGLAKVERAVREAAVTAPGPVIFGAKVHAP